jgi:hypothetical protein
MYFITVIMTVNTAPYHSIRSAVIVMAVSLKEKFISNSFELY